MRLFVAPLHNERKLVNVLVVETSFFWLRIFQTLRHWSYSEVHHSDLYVFCKYTFCAKTSDMLGHLHVVFFCVKFIQSSQP